MSSAFVAIGTCAIGIVVWAVADQPASAPARPATATEHCVSDACHARIGGRSVLHGSVARRTCIDCHQYANPAMHLFKRPTQELCINCHKKLIPKPGQDRSMHALARDTCTACHDPHGAQGKHELKQPVPGLCYSCHKEVEPSPAAAPFVHGAMTQADSCSNCHVSHGSTLPKLQKQPQPQQCLNCHDRPVKALDGRMLINMAGLLRDNPQQHGPVRLGACTACHQPHAGTQAQRLTEGYPPDFYAPFDVDRYKLCFGCHSPDMVLLPHATKLTGFTDGEKNLHALHVNNRQGRTCRACHEVHASRQPFHMRESVPFGPGGWPLAINFRQTPKGGSCSPGCHKERSYDHGERSHAVPVEALLPKAMALLHPEQGTGAATRPAAGDRGSYPVPPPPFSREVFPCTGCHVPNQPVKPERRVLQKAHRDIQLRHDEERRWCLDCHNAENRDVLRSASGAPIPFAESYRLCGQCHGDKYRDWKAGVHGKRTGQWNGRKEYLLCVHCHNPHSPKFKPIAPLPPPVRLGPVE